MFHIPENILEIFDPWKNYRLFIDMEQRRLPQYNKPITHYFDWKPLPPITIAEAEQFFQEELGMVRAEIDALDRDLIEKKQFHHKGMQYECSYMYADIGARNKWATQEEIEQYIAVEKTNDNAIKLMQEKAMETGDPDGLFQKYALEWERRKQHDIYPIVHLYSDRDGWFADIDGIGAVTMPKVALLSLHHLMGKAPTPEEMAYLWTRYLQFLIDIGYVNDFVKELDEF